MTDTDRDFQDVVLSLCDLTDAGSIGEACRARAFLSGESAETLLALAQQPVDFYPAAFQSRQHELLDRVGEIVQTPERQDSRIGATTRPFLAATRTDLSPLSTYGLFRMGEDGRLYLITKSEHYHASLGHSFPGYELVERARHLGIPNATHNNTRGWITRLLEERLVCAANRIDWGDRKALEEVLTSQDPGVINRVLNLETGSLAAEAALKMILARFYTPQEDSQTPKYRGRQPVILVVGNDEGGLQANYHGTTILTQMMRGMWPELLRPCDSQGMFAVRAVRPNCLEDLESVFKECETAPRKIAGFFHEIVMMNYGGRLLSRDFLQRAYELCRKHDVPTVVDEIQSCLWAPTFFMYHEYGLSPTFITVGKGFSGGEYPASRILFSAGMDNLPQFGALVTNGQEELASLSYLVTMQWARANAAVTSAIGVAYEDRLRDFADRHPTQLVGIEGRRHLSALCFKDLDSAKGFVHRSVGLGLDVSVQTYKSSAPPVVLTKIPLTADDRTVDVILDKMTKAMEA